MRGYDSRSALHENFIVDNVFYGNTVDMFSAFRNVDKCSFKLYAADNANGFGSGRDVQKLHKNQDRNVYRMVTQKIKVKIIPSSSYWRDF